MKKKTYKKSSQMEIAAKQVAYGAGYGLARDMLVDSFKPWIAKTLGSGVGAQNVDEVTATVVNASLLMAGASGIARDILKAGLASEGFRMSHNLGISAGLESKAGQEFL